MNAAVYFTNGTFYHIKENEALQKIGKFCRYSLKCDDFIKEILLVIRNLSTYL